jgi:predicted transcriptional regulator
MICSSCGNEFLQPFVCTTCGAQKLRDETVKALEAEIAALQINLVETRRHNKAMTKISQDCLDAKDKCNEELAKLKVDKAESVAQTREECAVIAETAADVLQNSTFDGVAAAIRALKETK